MCIAMTVSSNPVRFKLTHVSEGCVACSQGRIAFWYDLCVLIISATSSTLSAQACKIVSVVAVLWMGQNWLNQLHAASCRPVEQGFGHGTFQMFWPQPVLQPRPNRGA